MGAGTPEIQKLNHIAWRCRDAEETRAFYEDLLGLTLAHVVRADSVPSTGEAQRFAHLFFRMRDGSFVAFFDLGDGKAWTPDPATPPWVTHLSLEVDTREALLGAVERLRAAGVSVNGVIDHDWLQSIYFSDPNGIHLELSWRCATPETMQAFESRARGELDAWTRSKQVSV
jgi:glyoxylase I family protein